jgi:mRNA interferase HicA
LKRRLVEKRLKQLGWYLLRHGSNHDIWTNGQQQVEIPRHPEIREKTAKFGIIRKAEKFPGKIKK